MTIDHGDCDDTDLHQLPPQWSVCPDTCPIYIPTPPWAWIFWMAFVGIVGLIVPRETIDKGRPWNAHIPGRWATRNFTNTNGTSQTFQFFQNSYLHHQSNIGPDQRFEHFPVIYLWTINFPMLVVIREIVGLYLWRNGYPFWYADFRSFWEAYLIGFSCTVWTTKFLKMFTSQPRPDFLARCQLEFSTPGGIAKCLGTQRTIYKGYRSFPSGHASYVAFTTALISLWLCGKMSSLYMPSWNCRPIKSDRQFVVFFDPLRKFLCFWPMTIGILVGSSRIPDKLHFPVDFTFGFVLGLCFAVLFYNVYYPPPLGYEYYVDTPWRVIMTHPNYRPLRKMFAPLGRTHHRMAQSLDTADIEMNSAPPSPAAHVEPDNR